MRKRGVVAFDIDGVLANFTLGFTRMAALLGLVEAEWSNNQQKTWDFPFHVDPVWRAVDENPRFWLDLEPLAGAHDRMMMNDLAERVQIIYATHRHGSAEQQTVKWLERYGFPDGPVFLNSDKGALYKSLGDQLLAAIDDKPETCNLRANGLPMFVRDALYNKDAHAPRVFSVGGFVLEVRI